MNQKSRSRRVVEKREVISQWDENEGVSVSKLLGYLLYLENYQSGDRSLEDAGWRIFSGDQLAEKLKASLEEALWLIERACICILRSDSDLLTDLFFQLSCIL